MLATATHFSCLYLLVDVAKILPPVQASVIAFFCGACVGFWGNKKVVFKKPDAGLGTFAKYISLAISSGIANTTIMYILIENLSWHYMLAQFFATTCIFITNFIICKTWIFKDAARTTT